MRRRYTLQRCNVGFSVVMYQLWVLNKKDIPTEIVDVNCMPEEQIQNAYAEAIQLAVSRKFMIRRVFGTKHRSGFRFGKEVPALLVYEGEQEKLIDVYPRIEEQYRTVTIHNFLMSQAIRGMTG
ncbi:hypothetical protein ACFLX4_02095 [Chloroflexota bacterium]